MTDDRGAPDDLNAATIEAVVKGRLGRPLRYLDETPSTNSEALGWAQAGAPEGALVVAGHQTTGRGRWGREWFSPAGTALTFSLVLRPPLDPSSAGLLTAAVGVACAVGIRSSSALRPRLKWPNDVMLDGRKVAGILLESRVEAGRIRAVVAGVGVNVKTLTNAPTDVAERATTIADHVERAPSRALLLADILAGLEDLYRDAATAGFARRVIEEATGLSEVLGRGVMVRLAGGGSLEGRAERLTSRGELEVRTEDALVTVHSGEIERLRTS